MGDRPERPTFLRTAAALVFWVVAVHTGNLTWLGVALACYWVGDMSDGLLARLHWSLLSPNYFHLVDATVYR